MNVDLGGGGEVEKNEDEEGNCDAVREGVIVKPCHFVARIGQGHTSNTAECEAVGFQVPVIALIPFEESVSQCPLSIDSMIIQRMDWSLPVIPFLSDLLAYRALER